METKKEIAIGTIVRITGDKYSNYRVDGWDFGLNKEKVYTLTNQSPNWQTITRLEYEFEIYQTIESMKAIQRQQLDNWKLKLNAQLYTDLEAAFLDSNYGIIEPYNIKRGCEMDNFIGNWKPGKIPTIY